jgi:gliding motility-associated lipoprotein GldH
MIKIKQLIFSFIFLCIFSLSACDSNRVFEQNVDIPNNNWRIGDTKEFRFEITDTTKTYQVFFNIRNALFYEYYNLYISATLLDPDGQKLHNRLHEMFLMDKKTGAPLGKGAGDIFDHSVLALKNQHFTKPGTYTLKLTQYMRKNPLPGIMAVGIKVVAAE